VLTEVSLKVLPIAPAQTTLCFELGQAAALEQLHVWGAQPLPLNASCWVQDRGKDLLFVRLRGAVAAVEAACVRMLKDAPGTRIDDAQAVADWEQCRNHQLPFFAEPQHDDMALWRLSLPQTATVLDLPYAQLMEWHGALRWLWAPLHAQASIEAAAHAAHGTAGVFVRPKTSAHGTTHDAAHSTPRLVPQGPAAASAATVMKRLKSSFDPQGIFNPNVH
jgi:glycolate oxidase FAD binding subunit